MRGLNGRGECRVGKRRGREGDWIGLSGGNLRGEGLRVRGDEEEEGARRRGIGDMLMNEKKYQSR